MVSHLSPLFSSHLLEPAGLFEPPRNGSYGELLFGQRHPTLATPRAERMGQPRTQRAKRRRPGPWRWEKAGRNGLEAFEAMM